MSEELMGAEPEFEAPTNLPESASQEPEAIENEALNEGDEPEGEGQEPELELDEYEDEDGKRYKLPKHLIPRLMKDRDYTQKTQTVAEERRQIAEQRRALEARAVEQAKLDQEYVATASKLMSADEQIARYQKIDWAKLEAENPIDAMTRFREYGQWKEYRENLAKNVEQAEHRRAVEAQQITATRINEARDVLAREIPGWTTGVGQKVADYALSLGYAADELATSADPRLGYMLHQAWLGTQLKQKTVAKTTQPAAPAAQPLKQVSKGRTPAVSGLDDRLSSEEWVKRRNEQLRKRDAA